MIYKAFLVVLALAASYLVFDMARMHMLKRAIHDVGSNYVTGPENADLTVVEFMDYSCPKCRQTHPVFLEVINAEPSWRYIPRPLSETEDGKAAARFAYAAGRQGLFFDAHYKLLTAYQPMDEDYKQKLIAELGLDAEKLESDMNDPDIIKMIEKNGAYNAKLGSYTIPTFLINDKVLWIVSTQIPSVDAFRNVMNDAKR